MMLNKKVRKMISRNTFLLFVALLFSCENHQENTKVQLEPSNIEKALEVIKLEGHDIYHYKLDEVTNELTINHDMLFDFKNLYLTYDEIQKSPQTRNKAQFHDRKVRHAYITNLKVKMSGNFDSSKKAEWDGILKEAIKRWNAIPYSKVKFVYVTSGSDLTVHSKDLDGAYANAQMPWVPWYQIYESTAYPGEYLNVDLDACKYLSYNQKLETMMHELGHTIGYHHTFRSEAEKNSAGGWPGSHISGTSVYDPESIMKAYGFSNPVFSENDILGVQLKYKGDDLKPDALYVSSIWGSSSLSYGASSSWTVTYSGGYPSYSHQWYWMYGQPSGSSGKETGYGSSWTTISSGEGGNNRTLNKRMYSSFSLKCVVRDSKGNTSYKTKYINVASSNAGGSGEPDL